MYKNKTYSEKLRDPRWQKKRLEVFEHYNFQCYNCGDEKNSLNVHHLIYRKGKEPWEYSLDELQCLCADCHKQKEKSRASFNEMLLKIQLEGLGIEEIEWLAMGLLGDKGGLIAVYDSIEWKMKRWSKNK